MFGEKQHGFRQRGKVKILLTALRELGFSSVINFGLYRLGLLSGHYFRLTRTVKKERGHVASSNASFVLKKYIEIPDQKRLQEYLDGITGKSSMGSLLDEAEEVVNGHMRLFGRELTPIFQHDAGELRHWTEYECGRVKIEKGDIKFIWEPARLGWIFTIARAYACCGDERFAIAFWDHLKVFLDSNPPYLGPNWISSQEAALRVIAMAFGWQVFSGSPQSTLERTRLLTEAVAAHAIRIPPTICYARAQNNNHLLSEAVGLYTAGVLAPDHPRAADWRKKGWRIFHQGLRKQIDPSGAYIQHSTNYQRLMLQLGLWMQFNCKCSRGRFP